jgi:hypothetical protein
MPSPRQIADAFRDLSEAAQQLLAADPEMPAEDRQLWQDMLEGAAESTDPYSVLDRLAHGAVQDEHYAEGVRSFRRELAERLDRHLRGAETKRRMLKRFLECLQLSTLLRPTYSASIGAGRVHVLPTMKPEELPPRFQRVTVDVNKEALAAALKAGEDVPAHWSNAEPVLTIRTR